MDVGGGTLLMTMADLSRVQARVRVDETDLGKIAPGMPAVIKVASFPGKRFSGTIEKIEPQAVVEQNVTLFPVLISLENQERLLRPGMNVDVKFEVARRDDVLTVPVTALRTERDVDTTASITGLDPAAIRATLDKAGGWRTRPRANGSARDSAARFGGSFWVVVDRKGALEAVPIVTGITDLDRVEVTSGLAAGRVGARAAELEPRRGAGAAAELRALARRHPGHDAEAGRRRTAAGSPGPGAAGIDGVGVAKAPGR